MNESSKTEKIKTYIHNGKEVKLTGRTASKTTGKMSKRSAAKTVQIHEITPLDSDDGDWKEWVRLSDLYEVD